jgi:hypothetical protein
MKKGRNRYLSKGVRDRCASARSLCAKLELRSGDVADALERTFTPFLGGAELVQGVRRLTLVAINTLRQLIAQLLDAERCVHEIGVQCSEERERKNQALAAVHYLLTSFRRCRLWDRGPLVPRGPIPWQPEKLLAEAARVRPRLDSPHLQVSPDPFPGFEPASGLGAELDAATEELATAWTELGRSCHVLAAAREERDLAMDELHRYASGLRGLQRAVCALPATSITDVPETGDADR